MDQGSVYDLI